MKKQVFFAVEMGVNGGFFDGSSFCNGTKRHTITLFREQLICMMQQIIFFAQFKALPSTLILQLYPKKY
ncbi:hypothetical protein [Anoxynatronum sibiricum]|uniref:hypothetical protein n=1 Tax=Anoxynatronum sibiricum TaxID=210623 RepID=UPI0031B7FF56